MQKIIIKNFGPVKDAEIEIKKVMVLIGEQASGKSTIAKLIYFFKSLIQDVLNSVFESSESSDFNIEIDLANLVQQRFYMFFGYPSSLPSFEIEFYYSIEKNKYLRLKTDKYKHLIIQLSKDFFDDTFESLNTNFKALFNKIKKTFQVNKRLFEDTIFNEDNEFIYSQQDLMERHKISKLLNQLFENNQEKFLFLIAGRNVTVSHSDFFEKHFFANIQNNLNKNNIHSLESKIDDTLMFDFIKRVSLLKSIFMKFSTFEEFVENYIKSKSHQQELRKIILIINKILKGKYRIDNDGEKILLDNKKIIYLHSTSSGQQEVIRILQDIFMIVSQKSKVLRIIEEPEAHLFPVAQKQLIELLALMVNYQPENQLIITTHSPYILTVFNHLLFASRVVAKNPAAEEEVKEIVDKDCWLDPNEFSAYSLGNESFPEDNAKYCESIFDQEKGMLQQNYLDTVSEILGWEFSKLYSIHGKTFKRR
jgi:predicted ATPase